MKIRLNILILSLIFASVCLVGCKKKTEPVEADSNTAGPNIAQPVKVESKAIEPKITETTKVDIQTIESNVPAKAEPKEIVATVNGVEIIKSDCEARVEQQIGPVQRQMPANFFEQYKKELSKKVLDEMIVDILLAQKAKQKGLTVTEFV